MHGITHATHKFHTQTTARLSLPAHRQASPPERKARHHSQPSTQTHTTRTMPDESLEDWLQQRRSRRALPKYWKSVLDAAMDEPWLETLDAHAATHERRKKRMRALEKEMKKLAIRPTEKVKGGGRK
ncbi:hypothetical protein PsYK624_042650 [Phanerochaete sordida]|uniref:Uncharacterized protein n=1 Tax=Phanerochaete sordida TaxID=48140 RepID=A0A9P3LBU0_9APHY|nr:hypothetical protein PsYK624_042650 [Phanerochaete sordida]